MNEWADGWGVAALPAGTSRASRAATALALLEGKVVVAKLEMSSIVEFRKRGTVRVVALEVHVVVLGLTSCATALFADVHLVAPLLVAVLVRNAVNFERVRLERASLRK